MASLSTRTRVTVPDHVITRVVGGRTVILDVQSGRSFTLDPVGSQVWALLEQTKTLSGTIEALQRRFDAEPAQIERDVTDLVERLAAGALLTLTD